MPRSSVHRTLQELADDGIIQSDHDGSYCPAAGFARLAAVLSAATDLVALAMPHLEAARDSCGETVILTAYDPTRGKFAAIAAAESTRAVRYIWEALRDWSDLHLGASGKGILAFLPADEQQTALGSLSEAEKRRLCRDLAHIRRRGWAASVGERFPGAVGVSAPIRDSAHRVLGAVVIGWPNGPGQPRRRPELGALCRATADAISAELGYVASQLGEHRLTSDRKLSVS